MNFAVAMVCGPLLMLAVIATAAIIARVNRFYRREVAVSDGRVLSMDGLRGLAALMVMVSHASLLHALLVTQKWRSSEVSFLERLGPAGVLIFFMLTGYLFWNKARAANGKINPWKLWRGRFYRIAPLYFFSVLVIIVIMTVMTDGKCWTFENWKSFGRLLALGVLGWSGFEHPNAGFDEGSVNAGVVWTLWYEWRFYLFFPLLAWFAAGRRIFFLVAVVIGGWWFAGWMLYDSSIRYELFLVFLFGMLCPVLAEAPFGQVLFHHPASTGLALLFFIVMFEQSQDVVASLSMAGALFPPFLLATAGNTFFGLLTHPAIRCLGMVSYSLYLLHGIMFFVLVESLKMTGLTGLPQVYFWLLLIVTGVITTLICAVTYRWIEFPFLSAKAQRRRVGENKY